MKKFILSLFTLLIPMTGLAQSLELELIRTEESPGFFAVRIFPDKNLKEIEIEDIFVKNYQEKEAPVYRELIAILEELGGTIINPEELPQYRDPTNRIILLGGNPHNNFIHFVHEYNEEILSEFDTFAEINLSQPILLNITAEFGGNISDVYPKKITTMTDKPIFFVGKFVEPLKTKMTITALTHEGEIIAETPLHLESFEPGAFSAALPEIWEEVYQSTLPTPTSLSSKIIKKIPFNFNQAFPWILGILGLIVLAFAISVRTKFEPQKTIVHTPKKDPVPDPKNTTPQNIQDMQHDIEEVPEGFWYQPQDKIEKAMPLDKSKTTEGLVRDFHKDQ